MLRRAIKKWFPADPTILSALIAVRTKIERRNIAYPFDDRDIGYDMAIDEVLEIIDEAINNITSGNDVDYSGGL